MVGLSICHLIAPEACYTPQCCYCDTQSNCNKDEVGFKSNPDPGNIINGMGCRYSDKDGAFSGLGMGGEARKICEGGESRWGYCS